MTKPKGDKPAPREVRERAAKGDQSNEGAQAERDAVRAFVERRITKVNQRVARCTAAVLTTGERCELFAYREVRKFLDGRTARYRSRKGGLK